MQLAHPQIIAPHPAVHRTDTHMAVNFDEFNTPTQLSIIQDSHVDWLIWYFCSEGKKIKTAACLANSDVYTECPL